MPMSLDRSDRGRPGRSLRSFVEAARGVFDVLPPAALVAVVLVATGAVVVASGIAVAEILDEVMDGEAASRPDDRIVEWVSENRTERLTDAFRVVTRLADGWFVALLVAITAVVS